MTTSEVPVPTSPAPAPTPVVLPPANSRLEQLTAQYDEAKKTADEAAARLKEITDAIKSELTTAAPGAEKVLLQSSFLEKPLRMAHRVEWRFDSKRCKAQEPVTWVKYAYQVESWRLERTK